MIDVVLMHYSEDHTYKIDTVSVKTKDVSEKERIENLVEEHNLIGSTVVPVSPVLEKHIAETLKVDYRDISLDIQTYHYDIEIANLGFSEEDRGAVYSSLSLIHLTMEDWKSMMLFENDAEIFKYLYIDEEYDKEDYIRTILEMCENSDKALKEGRSLLECMIEENLSIFIGKVIKLPSGKWVILPDELLDKDLRFQMD